MKLPLKHWVHFEVYATLGAKTWDMKVTLPGMTPLECRMVPNGGGNFEQLTWIGFTSNATKGTVFYLDNIVIKNEV